MDSDVCQEMKIKSKKMDENITLYLPVIKMSIPVWEDFNPKFLRQKELPFIECRADNSRYQGSMPKGNLHTILDLTPLKCLISKKSDQLTPIF